MIYLVIGINHEGGILPLYSTDSEEQARKTLSNISIELEWRELKEVKLLTEIE